MSTMGWSKIRYTNAKVPKYRGWNPCGYGCSGGCDGCWARGLAKRVGGAGCEKCKAFVPHLHPERLSQPADTKMPAVVLSCFTADWLDPKRPPREVAQILMAIARADHHIFVTLTKNAEDAAGTDQCRHEYRGLTIRHQADADAKLPTFLRIPGKKWLSLEPLWGDVNLHPALCQHDGTETPTGRYGHWCTPSNQLSGVIVGHDNRTGAPGTNTLDHVRSVVRQCVDARVPVFVKQLHLGGKLCHDPAAFPEDLRHRDLPWSMPT